MPITYLSLEPWRAAWVSASLVQGQRGAWYMGKDVNILHRLVVESLLNIYYLHTK